MVHQINAKTFIVIILSALILLGSPVSSWAIEPNQQTWFNNITDGLATVGRDPADKKDIRRLRQESRRQYRLQKESLRKKSQTRKRMKQQQEAIKRKYQSGHTVIGQ